MNKKTNDRIKVKWWIWAYRRRGREQVFQPVHSRHQFEVVIAKRTMYIAHHCIDCECMRPFDVLFRVSFVTLIFNGSSNFCELKWVFAIEYIEDYAHTHTHIKLEIYECSLYLSSDWWKTPDWCQCKQLHHPNLANSSAAERLHTTVNFDILKRENQ